MMASLGPVQAPAREACRGRLQRIDLYAKLMKPATAGRRDRILFRGRIVHGQIIAGFELSGDGDAQTAGQMVVAGAAEPQAPGLGGQRGVKRADRRRKVSERFYRGRHLRRSEPIVAVAAFRLDRKEASLQ